MVSMIEGFPVSPQQRRLWELARRWGSFRTITLVRLEEPLHLGRLKAALAELVERHEILRTDFAVPDHLRTPLQIIAEEPNFDWQEWPETGERTWQRFLDAEQTLPDSPQSPPLRVILRRPNATSPQLLISLPSLCADHESMKQLVTQLSGLYRSREEENPAVSEAPIQYVQFSDWLEAFEEKAALGTAFWTKRLAEVPAAALSEEGSSQPTFSAQLDREFIPHLNALAKRCRCPVEHVLLCCWQIILARRLSLPRMSVARAFDGRSFEDLEEALGPFSRFLPINLDLSERPTFDQALGQLRDQMEQAEKWQHFYGLEQNTPTPAFGFHASSACSPMDHNGFHIERITSRREPFALLLKLTTRDSDLILEMEYRAETSSEAIRMDGFLAALCREAQHHPQWPVTRLSLLSPTEKLLVLEEFNRSVNHLPPVASVHRRFEVLAQKQPDAIALWAERQPGGAAGQWSFAELDRDAERWALLLRRRGIGPDRLVALHLERSRRWIVAMLAVLKAGGAFLPLDPRLPPARSALLLRESGCQMILSEAEPHPAADDPAGVLAERVDPAAEILLMNANPPREPPSRPLSPTLHPAHLAYIIFTSGSTGTPKGVAVSHGNLHHYLHGAERRLNMEPGFSYAAVSSLAADLGHSVLFPPLCLGGTLHLPPSSRLTQASQFGTYMARARIDVLKITPSHLAALLDCRKPALCLPRRRLILGGEALDPDLWDRIAAAAPKLDVYNHYGPSETTVGVIATSLATVEREAPIPLGRPMANARIYVLDTHMAPVPPGDRGQLFLGGPNLARGYLTRPAITADSFVPDPFGNEPGARLYRSGDLGHHDRLGRLYFDGRIDHQVKIRGFRVELGEIEAALAEHPAVQRNVVLVKAEDQTRLVAFVILKPHFQASPHIQATLRENMSQMLPAYMVPTRWVFLRRLPLTDNGKVDRNTLLRHESVPLADAGGEAETLSGTEGVLADIWKPLLGLERVSRHDNFFDLGGHSLNGTILMSRIREHFKVDLLLGAVFEKPNIAGLAQSIRTAILNKAQPEQLQDAWRKLARKSDSSTGTLVAADLADLEPAIQERLAALLLEGQEGLDEIPVLPRDRGNRFPLSHAQQRLWFLNKLSGPSAAYNISSSLKLTGSLSAIDLERAFSALLERHEVLRTVFPESEGQPVQAIQPTRIQALVLVDLSHVEPDTRKTTASKLTVKEATRPFCLERGPLLRTTLVRGALDHHDLLATKHHIVSDFWSKQIMVRELITLYGAILRGTPPPLPALPIQYADFSHWQRRRLDEGALAEQNEYWRRRLAGAPTLLQLHGDRPRPPIQEFAGGMTGFVIDDALTAPLIRLAKERQASLFMLFHTSFALLLSRYSNQNDLVIGTPIANRNRPEIEPLIGFFVNTLALRSHIRHEDRFEDLLERSRNRTLEDFHHQDLPFETVVETLETPRNLSHSPIFQVMFTFQPRNSETEIEQPATEDLHITGRLPEHHSSKFDITLFIRQTASRFYGYFEYSSALFNATSMQRMGRHYCFLLRQLLEKEHQPLRHLQWLPADERHRVLVAWNDGTETQPDQGSITERVQNHARQQPDALALSTDDRFLSYGELARQSEGWCAGLMARGLGAEDRVAIEMEPGIASVLAQLAVLKTGAAFLPLDPHSPEQRNAYMLADADVACLLVTDEHQNPASEEKWDLVVFDPIPAHSAAAEVLFSAPCHPAQGAYIIYTSGSTGRPKGTMIPHSAMLNLIDWHQKAFGLTSRDRASLLAGPAFDASLWETWPYLCAGASLHAVDRALSASPQALADWLCRRAMTMGFLPTPVFEAMPNPPRFEALRFLLVGGDRLHQHPAEPTPFRLINNYGPTENAVVASSGPVLPRPPGAVPSLGRPIANVTIYILDPGLEPLPVGVPGELCIAGSSLARGYLARPELTAGAFVPNPFGQEKGARLYRSGDRALWRADGELTFLGRLDHQIKLRGFRIELGEIENCLQAVEEVNRAVVLLIKHPKGSDRLAAFVESPASADAAPDRNDRFKQDLIQTVGELLPAYMVPQLVILMDTFPLTVNGKLDRAALRQHPRATGEDRPRTARLNPREQIIAGVWQDLLRLENIGPEGHFFELGGHSLLATQVVARLQQIFQIQLPLRSLFEEPTLSGFARRIEAAGLSSEAYIETAITPVSRRHDLPLSFAQQRLWFLDQLEDSGATYNIPMALRLGGRLAPLLLEQAVTAIRNRHEVLRTRFPVFDGKPTQAIDPPEPYPLKAVDLKGLSGAARTRLLDNLAAREAVLPFDLEAGPLLRSTLLVLDERDHAFLATMHHIVSDGWSFGLLIRELAAFYQAAVQEKPAPLEPLLIQYADFSHWQRSWLKGQVLKNQLDYWENHLTGAPALLELPSDFPRPSVQRFRGGNLQSRVGSTTASGLQSLSRELGVTLFMSLQAAFAVLLARYSGQRDILIGSPVANRTRKELEPLIGFFVNTLVLRTRLERDQPFGKLLQQTRRAALSAYENQDIPFEFLVETLQPERNLAHSPLFQVNFALQNAPLGQLELPGLTIGRVGVAATTSKFDMTLFMGETPEGLYITVEYSTDLWRASTIDRFVEHFRNLLAAIIEDPGQEVLRLEFLSEEEHQLLLRTWNQTEQPPTGPACLQDLWRDQLAQTPDATAIIHRFGRQNEARFSLKFLDETANGIARTLIEAGIGPESRVAVCMGRSPLLIAALLGTLKAGAAYVPLDTSHPPARLRFLMADARPGLVLEDEENSRLLDLVYENHPRDKQPRRLVLSTRVFSAPFSVAPIRNYDPKQLAYMIYTSGSTGQPKGVLIAQASLVHYLGWATHFYRIRESRGFPLHATLSFDATITALWTPLLCGKSVTLLEQGEELAGLAAGLRHGLAFDALKITPAHLEALNQTADATIKNPAIVIVGGEALPPSSLAQWRQRAPQSRVINEYGPTETVVGCCVYEVPPDGFAGASVPIGRPIANTALYILDGYLKPVPRGVFGQLFIAGPGLGRGYWQRPDLTAEAFIPNPFSARPGRRLYVSGDRTRYLADGIIEYGGRLDHQIKLRGYRIEPGEIEAVLARHPAVLENKVIIREDRPGGFRLAAYAVADPDVLWDSQELLARARQGQLDQWEAVFQDSYKSPVQGEDPTLNLAGWNDSYTGAPIPSENMRVWVETTVSRILAHKPRRVLEIGCGSGLLLFRIAPHCRSYTGTDLSAEALAYVDAHLHTAALEHTRVTLFHQSAEQFSGLEDQRFDTIILNSVVQYFPSLDYLQQVLGKLMALATPDGRIFVGDVRSLPLLKAFHGSVRLFRSEPSTGLTQLNQRIEEGMRLDPELVLDPRFFQAFPRQGNGVQDIKILLKRGRAHNELTCFRYDVVLQMGKTQNPSEPGTSWRVGEDSLATLEERLTTEKPAILALTRITNIRLAQPNALLDRLSGDEFGDDARLGSDLEHHLHEDAQDPEAFWEMAERSGYRLEIGWGNGERRGEFYALFQYDPSERSGGDTVSFSLEQPLADGDPGTWANSPLSIHLERALTLELRNLAATHLPEYMVPSAILLLREMPLTPNGKIDIKALPAPEVSPLEGRLDAPRTTTEELLEGIWSQVLGLEKLGTQTHFFDVGGHSLLATQVISRIGSCFGVALPLRTLFEAPTIAALAAVVDAAQKGGSERLLAAIEPVSRDRDLPLSFAQQRLWFLDQLEGADATYNLPIGLALRGALDAEALAASLNALLARHEPLRTHFPQSDGAPIQRIEPPRVTPLVVPDLSGLDPDVRNTTLKSLVAEIHLTPFRLDRGPLFRMLLPRLGSRHHGLVLAKHHIISDGWSMGLVVGELVKLYGAFTRGRPNPLTPLKLQYADFAHWQRQWLQGEALEEQIRFWKHHLAGAPALLELYTDRPRPRIQTFNGALYGFAVDQATTRALKRLSRARGTTLFMTLQAAFALLLKRYSNQADVVLGTSIANRNHEALEPMVGFFVNTLALRCDLGGNPDFGQLLDRIRKLDLEAFHHQDIPFEKVVEVLQPERNLSHAPLFQVLFELQNTPGDPLVLPGLELAPLSSGHISAKFDLNLSLQEREDGLGATVEFNTDLFDRSTVVQMSQHYRNLLAAIGSAEGESSKGRSLPPISAIPMLVAPELRRLLFTWNQTTPRVAFPLHYLERVTQTWDRIPDSVAAVYIPSPNRQSPRTRHLSYGLLKRKVMERARLLQSRGIGPERIVALLAERDLEFLVDVLAILMAGGVYLPLDPKQPTARIRVILETSRAAMIVSRQGFNEKVNAVTEGFATPVEVWFLSPMATQGQPPCKLTHHRPEQLVYVIFTSGSTGLPKGAMLHHAGFLNHLCALVESCAMDDEEIIAQNAVQSFDISVWQLLTAPFLAARVVILADETAVDPQLLLRHVAEQNITILELVPSLLEAVLEECEPGNLQPWYRLRRLIPTGEALSPQLARRWLKSYPRVPLLNAYGPTECSDDVTWNTIRRPPPPELVNMSIGRPVAHTQIYLLDARLELSPPGVGGELAIGGIGVGRGYLRDPVRTAQSFIPHPFSRQPGERIYKSGDLVRYRPDGTIEFLGRLDFQVKIRGFRIEIGEIETALLGHPQVRGVVVLARRDLSGNQQLAAYILVTSPEGDEAPVFPLKTATLREFLGERLPAYMVPNAFAFMDALPLSPSGKVDRRALGRLALDRPANAGRRSETRGTSTQGEEILAAIWCDVLGLKAVDPRDDFFELGGHSLLATKVASRIRGAFDLEFPLRELFEYPQIAALHIRIERLKQERRQHLRPPLRPYDRRGRLPLSFAQQRLWFMNRLDPANNAYNIPTVTRAQGALSCLALERALNAIPERHEVLRTGFGLGENQPVQWIRPFVDKPLAVIDLSAFAPKPAQTHLDELLKREARFTFDLESGPLWRNLLFRNAAHDHVLMLNTHHIIFDGWSAGVLQTELITLYRAFEADSPFPLAPLPIQYGDYALWQREWMDSPSFKEDLTYWQHQLKGIPAIQKLPVSFPRRDRSLYAAGHHVFRLEESLGVALKELCRREGVTLFMLLLAAFDILLHCHTGEERIVVGTDVANRNQLELEGLIGFFINQLALCSDLSGDPDFLELLKRIRETTLGAYAHQDMPFDKLVEVLTPERVAGFSPFFQVKFALFNLPPASPPETHRVALTPVTATVETTKLDLQLNMWEGDRFINGDLVFKRDLFDKAILVRFQRHYTAILQQIADHHHTLLSAFGPLLKEEDNRHKSAQLQKMKGKGFQRFKKNKKPSDKGSFK